jgi:hypothetical protein
MKIEGLASEEKERMRIEELASGRRLGRGE